MVLVMFETIAAKLVYFALKVKDWLNVKWGGCVFAMQLWLTVRFKIYEIIHTDGYLNDLSNGICQLEKYCWEVDKFCT